MLIKICTCQHILGSYQNRSVTNHSRCLNPTIASVNAFRTKQKGKQSQKLPTAKVPHRHQPYTCIYVRNLTSRFLSEKWNAGAGPKDQQEQERRPQWCSLPTLPHGHSTLSHDSTAATTRLTMLQSTDVTCQTTATNGGERDAMQERSRTTRRLRNVEVERLTAWRQDVVDTRKMRETDRANLYWVELKLQRSVNNSSDNNKRLSEVQRLLRIISDNNNYNNNPTLGASVTNNFR